MNAKLVSIYFIVLLATGCKSSSIPVTHDLCALVPFEQGVSISPEYIATTGTSEYTLVYEISADKTEISTTYFGPSEALSAGLQIYKRFDNGWHELICEVSGSEYRIMIARWKTTQDGIISDIFVRTKPIIEIRPLKLQPGHLVSEVEWRPYSKGQGVGVWKR